MNSRTSHRRVFRRVYVLPSLLTLGNFSCGFISIVLCMNALYFATRAQIFEERPAAGSPVAVVKGIVPDFGVGKEERHAFALQSVEGARARSGALFHWACVVIFLGMIFDMLDGKVARHVGAASAFGTELDSLADVISFGVAPAIIVNALAMTLLPATYAWWNQMIIFGVIYAVCAVLRLARYNIQSGAADKNIFSGLPSPAAAGCVVSAVLFLEGDYAVVEAFCDWLAGLAFLNTSVVQIKVVILAAFLLLPGILMITTVPFSHVANRYLAGKKSFAILVLAVLLLILVWQEPRLMLFLIFNGYMVMGLLIAARRKAFGGGQPPAADFEETEEDEDEAAY